MLHIDLTILWVIIDLIILYFILKKFLFGRVRDVIARREGQIKKSYDDAASVKADAQALHEKYEAQQQSAQAEAANIRTEAIKKANAEYDRILGEASDRSDQMIEEAKKKAQAAAEIERREAEEKITDLVKNAAAKLVDSQTDEQMYDAFLKEVEK
ncbi:putative ATP synthase F0, B subunit [Shuttleworthella sp. MSX8B]|uniref:F0F1 ATP synthase subunit B family protein n=1 Tax=Shuttleworthella TaxID=177971 RepID=UPI00044E00B2|nr:MULTISPECIES: ATP synthase F0 subunit B [Shuttleworthia]EUB17083.1 putative ATP synthase F0, B subunit [Shuttleworthia sp. MSX8B]